MVDLVTDDGERLVELELDLAAIVQDHLDLERAPFDLAVADRALAGVRPRASVARWRSVPVIGASSSSDTAVAVATPAVTPSPIVPAANAATMNAVLRFMGGSSSRGSVGRSHSAGA